MKGLDESGNILEINKLENQLQEKKRELGTAYSEIKALKANNATKDRALKELQNEVNMMDERLRVLEKVLEQKNLEISELVSKRKDAMAAQFAAEATLRRVYVNQKHSGSERIDTFIAPLEAEIKIYKNEIASLQEDKKALKRLARSKELALLEADKILKMALERALIVEEVQNQNINLRRQIEICLEENKILSKANRQKVVEVDKLSQTVKELEEVILAGGSAANIIRDCERQISELNEEKQVLERELSRTRVAANRVATAVSCEWKDEAEKVMPVKQWLEERRLLQAEMQRLRDKLTASEKTAKAATQLKERVQLRLKILEDGLKNKSHNIDKHIQLSGATQRKRSSSQPRAIKDAPLKQTNSFQTDAIKSKATEILQKENKRENSDIKLSNFEDDNVVSRAMETKQSENKADEVNRNEVADGQDMVSGFLYDRLQKEVINLRKVCEARECLLVSKYDEIKLLTRKVDALAKAIEVESRKIKREIRVRENEVALSNSK